MTIPSQDRDSKQYDDRPSVLAWFVAGWALGVATVLATLALSATAWAAVW